MQALRPAAGEAKMTSSAHMRMISRITQRRYPPSKSSSGGGDLFLASLPVCPAMPALVAS